MKNLKLIIITILFFFTSCEDDVKFKFDLDDLTGTKWGVPDIIELAPDVTEYDLSAPTIFYEDGNMTIGDSRYDFWRIRNSQSLHIERIAEIWLIIELTPDKLHVEKSKYPSGKFLLRCVYPSIEEK